MSSKILDCIIIGHNEMDPQDMMTNRKLMNNYSGDFTAQMDIITRLNNRWVTYMDFLNYILKIATGTEWKLNSMNLPNLAVSYLKSFLTRNDLEVDMINYYNKGKERLKSLLLSGPRAVAISTSFCIEPDTVKEIVQFIRKHNNETTIIAGGPYILATCSAADDKYKDYILGYIGADIYINESQGELTLSRILHKLREGDEKHISEIPNIIYKDEQDNIQNAPRMPRFKRTSREIENNNIDENVIDWCLIPKALYTPTVQMLTARGCAFRCAFCSFPFFNGNVARKSIRVIEGEMKQFHRAGVTNIFFIDDSFNVPSQRFKKILKMMIDNEFNFSWFSFFRCANADDETFDLMKKSGCTGVLLGIESGNPDILKNMNKQASIDEYKQGIKRLKERDIETCGSFIIGFPGETEETVKDSINFIQETMLDFYQFNLFVYMHNTPIHTRASEFGLQGQFLTWCHNTMDWQKASELLVMVHESINGSIYLPGSIGLWGVAYLYGLGVPMENIKAFLRLLRPIRLQNFASSPVPGIEDYIPQEQMLSMGQKVASHIKANQACF